MSLDALSSAKSPVSSRPLSPLEAAQQLETIQFALESDGIEGKRSWTQEGLRANSPCECLPAPDPSLATAPAGHGLQKNVEGFGPNAVKTSGGYVIVPEGQNEAWAIYGPGQKPGDTPLTRVWGDPHVVEGDGTKWDFTKDSRFRLPDGTEISVKTTSQTGRSFTKSLEITNGMDRCTMTGINDNKDIQVSEIGQLTVEQLLSRSEGGDVYHLADDANGVRWFQERHGVMRGEVIGSDELADKSYEQTVRPGTGFLLYGGARMTPTLIGWNDQFLFEYSALLASLNKTGPEEDAPWLEELRLGKAQVQESVDAVTEMFKLCNVATPAQPIYT